MIGSTPLARRRILFCAESITLSQVVRLLVLSRALDRDVYEVHFAAGAFDETCFAGSDVVRHVIPTVKAATVLRRVGWGCRPYGRPTLRRYVQSELALFARVRPDVVVGDFRLSLAVSAPVARVPYVNLVNAYWSPWAARDRWPVPDHPVLSLLAVETVERHVGTVLPWMRRHFAAPLDAVRAEYGLPPLGDLLAMLTAGDLVLHPDVPELVPTSGQPAHHRYLGSVSWSPAVPIPVSFRAAEPGPPWVYVTLGSSGDLDTLPAVLEALVTLPVRVMVATADRRAQACAGGALHVTSYLPGDEAARLAAFVVCNGGSSTAYQALYEGTPVLGLPANLDQHLAMAAIVRRGAGIGVRAQGARATAIREAASALLCRDGFAEAARAVAADMRRYDAQAGFAARLSTMLGGGIRIEPTRAAGGESCA